MRNVYKILVGKPERKKHFGDLGIYGKIILKWILKEGREGINWILLAQLGSSGRILLTR
jgi:hypothetical protein